MYLNGEVIKMVKCLECGKTRFNLVMTYKDNKDLIQCLECKRIISVSWINAMNSDII